MKNLPLPYSETNAAHGLAQWLESAEKQSDAALADWMREAAAPQHPARFLMASVFGNSPYLSRLLLLYPGILQQFIQQDCNAACTRMLAELQAQHIADMGDNKQLMRQLRATKGKLALLVALADIADVWRWEEVTAALSDFAEFSLNKAIDALLLAAHRRGDIMLPHPDTPSRDCGIIVLGMGKLGGRELNYSSDIDLIIFFERDRLSYKGRHNEQHFMNKLAHDIVHIMQERTSDGYVFRTDLRLRPDPASTPPAITIEAAYYYYESVGQNWERAAMIKARPVAGDYEAGERFLKNIAPFMWRRSLDFASINDIHSIKRQMDTRQNKDIRLAGHNIKLGLGGIREIEFYVQIHQLIWGGREPLLRTRATCETLARLTELGLVNQENEATLHNAYGFLRKLEHRLQMVADEQTHTMPDNDDAIAHIAYFMGYASTESFAKALFPHLHGVHAIYSSSFRGSEALADEGNLVFTGVSHDPDTLQTLRNMGYQHAERVSEIIMGWHHGSKRATRTKRARELLTELMPTLLKRLSETVNADAAFLKFNEFLDHLPAAVQLFSLFNANPHLLRLIADIMGSAPTLADKLSRSPELLDSVLYADFYETLPTTAQLTTQIEEMLLSLQDFEDRMDALRRFRNEKQFQAGVQLLKHMVTAEACGRFLASLADVMVGQALQSVNDDFVKQYGIIAGSRFAIIALGKLGSREMTFSSDIDLVFIYDVPDFDTYSDGEKSFTASVYYNRLSQRFLNALSAMGREGRLYEVDTRLRPSGKEGLLAVSTRALTHYFDELAWTFEFMAFTKARPMAGDLSLQKELEQFIISQLGKPRDMKKLHHDVADMRERIDKEHGTDNPWDIKYARGGLIDIDFMAQYLLLLHAPGMNAPMPGSASDIILQLEHAGNIDSTFAETLLEADRFLGRVFNMLRLCCDRHFDEPTAPEGLKKLLYQDLGEASFEDLKKRLLQVEERVYAQYNAIFITP